ncbi:MAG: histidinol-phosphate transaminase [Devosia sp.]|nr:histidinol-phosphate transaminase [Devosia sp.]
MAYLSETVRPEMRLVPPYNSGLTIEEVRQRYHVSTIAKLGSNENPLGPSASISAITSRLSEMSRLYPDPQGRMLSARLAGVHGVAPEQIILGNGSEDLIAVICRSIVRPGDEVVTLFPSFPLHEDYTVLMGGRVKRVQVTDQLEIDGEALFRSVAAAPRMVMFSNPMNPVGSWLDPAGMQALIAAHTADTLLVIDEAYAEYAAGPNYPDTVGLLRAHKNRNWVVLRTFSKAYGLAGLRIGYGIVGDPGLSDYFNRARTPFNTNAVAQAAAVLALEDVEHLRKSVGLALSERTRVAARLRELGFRVAPSKGNFLFFDVGRDASLASETLLEVGVIVKPWKQDGFRTFMRVSIGSAAENDQFLEAVKQLAPSG